MFCSSGGSCKENGVMVLILNNEGDAERSIIDNAIENIHSHRSKFGVMSVYRPT